MIMEQLYQPVKKLQIKRNPSLSDAIIESVTQNNNYNKSKGISQSKTNHKQSNFGQFQIMASIPHKDFVNVDRVVFYDYLCVKQKMQKKGLKRTEFSQQSQVIKKSLYLMCRANPTHKKVMELDFYELRKLFQEIILLDNKPKAFFNLIFPVKDKQSLMSTKQEKFFPFDISAITSIISNIETFYPLKNMTYSQKNQSQLYCLNLFYRFLLNIANPLFKIVKVVHAIHQNLMQTIQSFFLDCLIIENVFYEERTNQFYLFCNNQRYQQKQQTKSQEKQLSARKQANKSKQQIEKSLLTKISTIFWTLFFPQTKTKQNGNQFLHLHNSFMSNFLSAIKHQELTLQETLQILESKQKRKAFINSKIQMSQQKQQNDYNFTIGKRKFSIQQKYSETVDVGNSINGANTIQITDGGLSNMPGQKQRSVKRKLKEKRNTIDVMFQNYLTSNKDVPPSFLNRSLEKKGRLFKHEKSVHKSRSRDKSIQSYFGTTQKQSLQNHSLNYSSSKKKSISSYNPQIKNSRYNLVDKFVSRQVSKTIQISEINQLKERIKQTVVSKNSETIGFQNQKQTENSALQRFQSFSFVKTNPKSSKIYLKSSTQKLSIKQKNMNKQLNNNHVTVLSTKQKIFIKTDSIHNPTNKLINPSKNRRYYYHPNNFTSSIMDNQSIKRLIQDQLELHRTLQTQKSREKQLLNKSQQKALANFNREFKKGSQHNSDEKSLTISKSKEFNVKINKNISSLTKKDYVKNTLQSQGQRNQNIKRPHSGFKSLLGNKNSIYHSGKLMESFSPPKSKNKSKYQAFRAQFSPQFIQDRNHNNVNFKIDDKQFKAKLTSYFTTDINAYHENSIEESPKKINLAVKSHSQIVQNIMKNLNEKKPVENTKEVSQIYKQIINQPVSLKNQNKKIQNQYFVETKDQNELKKAQGSEKQIKKVSLDRTQKGLINAAKKLNQKINNKNFNVEQIFVEQQAISKVQQQIRRASKKQVIKSESQKEQDQEAVEDERYQISLEDRLSELKKAEDLMELQNMISPIKSSQVPNTQRVGIQKVHKERHQQEKINQKGLLDKTDNFANKDQKYQNQKINQKLQMTNTNQIPNNLHSADKQKVSQQTKKVTFLDMSKEQIQIDIEQAKVIQKKPITIINKNQQKSNSESKASEIQQTKQVKKQPKKVKTIINDDDIQLQEISLAPVKIPSKNQVKKPQLANPKKTIESQSDKSQKQISINKFSINKQKQELKSQRKIQTQKNQPPLPQKVNQQAYQPQKIQTSDKKGKQSNRQNTSKSSQASSYGPHKSVKKIVEQYVFFVNRIGQAVAKSALVSKKVQKVCEWYVGVYFLYKRFFYERRKIEKFLKEGIPKLTRYDEEINKDEWLLYLKSNDRQQLLNKLSQQNIKITQSLQKMQGKLMARKVPDDIKRFSAISQRSSQQSLIAIQAVIDEFDALTDNGMLKDEDILCHCTSLLNGCLVLAELDKLVEDIVPISELLKPKRTPEQLEVIAQDLFDLYHGEDQESAKQQQNQKRDSNNKSKQK